MTDPPLTAEAYLADLVRRPELSPEWREGIEYARLGWAAWVAAHPPATVPDEGLDVRESDPIETFSHPYRAPVAIDGHQYVHTSDCEWPALSKPETGQELAAGRLDAALGRMDESDFWYEDDRRNTVGEPLDPELYVRYEALRAALSTDDEVGTHD